MDVCAPFVRKKIRMTEERERREEKRTTSALTPWIPSPFVFFTVAVKNMGSPFVPGFARLAPDGNSGASAVQNGPGSQLSVHPYKPHR